MLRLHRQAAPGRPTALLFHPGALPVSVHRATAEALPDGVGMTVLDISALPGYRPPMREGEAEVGTLAELLEHLRKEWSPPPAGAAPYVLTGWSFGGVVAHALTASLPAAERPSKLVLLDSIAATEAYTRRDDELEVATLLSWFALYLGARRGRAVPVSAASLTGRDTDRGLTQVLAAAVACGALADDVTLPGLRKLYAGYVDGLLRNNRLTATHRPVPVDVPITLVRAKRGLIQDEEDLGWRPLAGAGLTVRQCPGDHYTMLSRPDAVRVLADEISRA
ncbi:alpha/beta fold hydrolase [Streptomyces sp. PT12]|uniref:thioesterase domain-containing protein n=1 Tax=Streptomyces sp. PT12 TaxID=1510197 RepID=UPI00215B7B6F|nr:alpha/beta fold hydrolase [Streptomyces sp. PT12]